MSRELLRIGGRVQRTVIELRCHRATHSVPCRLRSFANALSELPEQK